MKKILMLLAISAMALPAITAAAIDTNLKYGARGTEVSELQEFLIDKGFFLSAPTGNFYSLTLKAVIAYQTSVALPATGFVGPMTRGIINQELADTSTQAEVTETGTTTPPITESPIDLLKKQVALLMQQIQVLQGQANTQNQILQNQQTQQAAQNQQAQQTQQQLGQIVTNTTPPAPAPAPTPTPAPAPVAKPILKAKIDPVSYIGPVSSASLSNMQIPVFTANSGLPKLNVKMHIYTTEHGLSFDYLQLNGMKFQKVSQNVTQSNGKYATSTYDYELTTSTVIYGDWPGNALALSNVLYKESYPYPDFVVTLTLELIGDWICPDNYSSCEFPSFPITNTVIINPRSQ